MEKILLGSFQTNRSDSDSTTKEERRYFQSLRIAKAQSFRLGAVSLLI